MEPEYQNVAVTTQPPAARLNSGKLSKKPKPGPKPSYVAVKVAELNLKQRISSNESNNSSRLSLSKPSAQPAGCRSGVRHGVTMASSRCEEQQEEDDMAEELYETAVGVDMAAVRRIQQTANSDVSSVVGGADMVGTVHGDGVYCSVDDDDDDTDEPLYDDAIAVNCLASAAASHGDYDELLEAAVYEEAIIVQRGQPLIMDDTDEPLYAEPDFDTSMIRHTVNNDDESSLYEQALPVTTANHTPAR